MQDLYMRELHPNSYQLLNSYSYTKIPANLSLIMEIQTLAVTNSTILQLFFAVVAFVFCTVLLLAKVKKNTKLCKPIMEIGREKGELVIGSNDITC